MRKSVLGTAVFASLTWLAVAGPGREARTAEEIRAAGRFAPAASPVWDTIGTSCTNLTVGNMGNFGNEGIGRVNMDYLDALGDVADVYLYDGSPVVGYVKDGDTIVNFCVLGVTEADLNGFVPVGPYTPKYDSGACQIFRSGKFVTHDSLIAVEKVWYAPTGHADTCRLVIERISLYANRDTIITGVRIGEVIDWNIPADTNTRNHGGFHIVPPVMYQRGSEEDGQGPDNSLRWGGMDLIDCYHNGVRCGEDPDTVGLWPYGAYVWPKAPHVAPSNGFIPESLYVNMDMSGFRSPDSNNVDLYTMMAFDNGLTLTPADTYIYYVGIVSQYQATAQEFDDQVLGAIRWYCDHIAPESCRPCIWGDVDDNDSLNVRDLIYLYDYLYTGGPEPPRYEQADLDNYETVTGRDLAYLVDFMFLGAPAGSCPPENPPLDPPPNTTTMVTVVDTVFPADTETFSLRLDFLNSSAVTNAILPIRIRVDDEVPSIDRVYIFPHMTSVFDFVDEGFIDADSGMVMFGFQRLFNDGLDPDTGSMAAIDISTAPSSTDRPITVEWDVFPRPVHDGLYSHYCPMVIEPDSTTWRPDLRVRPRPILCGDVNYDYLVDTADITYLRDYLYRAGAEPPVHEEADVDNYEVVTVRDLAILTGFLLCGGPALSCPPANPELLPPLSTSNYIMQVGTVFPADSSTATLYLTLTNSLPMWGGTFPLSIRVDGEAPDIGNVQLSPHMDVFEIKETVLDSGKVLFGLADSACETLDPGYGWLASLDVIMEPSAVNRQITIAWDSFPPVCEDQYSNYAMLVGSLPFGLPFSAVTPELRTSCIGLCGDVNHSGSVSPVDWAYLDSYLYSSGPVPPCYDEADVDGYQVVTIRDFIYITDCIDKGDCSLTCPASYPKLAGSVSGADSLLLIDTIFPADSTSMTLHFNLETSVPLHVLSLPVRIRVDKDVPTLTNLQVTSLLDGFIDVRKTVPDSPLGRVLFSFGNYARRPVGPLSGEMATVDITMPASPYDRVISLGWSLFPPRHDYQSSHYPLLVEPDGTAWRPNLVPPPCCNGDGIRGNADGITGAGGEVDVADLSYLVAYLFLGGPPPACEEEGNVDGFISAGGPTDVADLTYLVAYLFLGGPPPVPCP